MTELLWLVIALPLAGAVINLFFGKRLGQPLAGWIAVGAVVAAWAVAVPATWAFVTGTGQVEVIYLFSWIPIVGADAAILWDPLSALMTMVVTGIGALIHVYSVGYMAGDDRFPRFFAFLNLFIASMMILVLSSNFAMMFVGWELVGLSSYLLISFWFQKPEAAAAGRKAFVVNRIGDWGFLVALMIIFAKFGTFDFHTIFGSAAGVLTVGAATAITLLLFVGAAGKSAQIPLYIWLPDAMEGPTPVSALIHAATMVTAGVFMIARAAVLFELATVTGALIAVIGMMTALLGAVIALSQRDIKKVLAYSTISQLGYMVFAVGIGAYTIGIFHLTTHAFFKALLFLGAGSVIHAMAGEQDMRKMGGLRSKLPITFVVMAIGWLAISGIFPFAGFWSKDEILAAAFAKGGAYLVLWVVGLVVALLTAFYMTRLFVMTFLGEPRWAEGTHPHESPPTMTIPLIILALFSVFAGLVNTPFRLGLKHYLEPAFAGVVQYKGLTMGTIVMLAGVALAVAVAGIAWGWIVYSRDELPAEEGAFWRRSREAFSVDEFYGRSIVVPGRRVSEWAAVTMDPKVIDGAAHGIAGGVRRFGSVLSRLQTGQVRGYAGGVAVGGMILIFALLALGGGF